jgi:hypothetical protein
MGTPVPYGGFPLTNLNIKMLLHLKVLIKVEMPLINSSCPPPVECNNQEFNMSAFPIQQPHQEDLRIVCCLIERILFCLIFII